MLLYKFLEAAGEPPLDSPAPDALESYRLAVFGSGWIRQTVIRFDRRYNRDLEEEWAKNDPHLILPPNKFFLVVHREDDDHRPATTKAQLGEEQWQCLLALLSATRFWELSADGGNSGGMDAATYYLEGFKEGRAHRVRRCSPNVQDDAEYFALPCCYLWDLATLAELGGF